MTTTSRTGRRLGRGLAAVALLGLAVPVATVAAAPSAMAEKPGYSGFSTEATATPVLVEIYEPTVPIPASPQFELQFGYSKVEASTTSSAGRASYLWPGDSIGEGAKTVIDQFGLPEQIGGPIAAQGYPFQVNSGHPSDQESERDEPFPGMVMRTSAAADRTTASTGYSTDCQVERAPAEEGQEGEEAPGLPELPVPSGLPGLGGLTGAATKGGQERAGGGTAAKRDRRTRAAAGEDETSCELPAELAALVDFGGYVSTSEATNDGETVRSTSRAALSDIDLLGGVISISGVSSRTTAASDGTTGDPGAGAHYGTLTIGPAEFAIGPGGVEGGGEQQEIPGLPDDPEKALAELGVTITVPEPVTRRIGDQAISSAEGLIVEIESAKLRAMLDDVPFDDLVDQVPDETGQLKSLLGAAVHLAPRYVITLGSASTVVDTVDPIAAPPAAPTGNAGGNGAAGGGGATGGGSAAPTAAAPGGSAAPGVAADAPGNGATTGELTGAEQMGNGLPPLNSIPGALTLGGIIAAVAAGSWLRKIGAIALGGAGTCPHGLDSGLPDLRKA